MVEIAPSGSNRSGTEPVLFSFGFNIRNSKENAELIAVYERALEDIKTAFNAMPEYAGFTGNTSNLCKGLIKYARDQLAEQE